MGYWSMLANACTKSKTLENMVMSLIQDSTKLHHLLQIHSFLIKTSIDRNNFALSKFLNKLCSCSSSYNDLSYARSVFDAIQSPDAFIWNTTIRAYLNSQNTNECLSLFAQMRLQEGIFVDSFSFSLVLQACGRSNDKLYGTSIYALLLKLGFGCDLYVQTALVEMYAKVGCIDMANQIFNEINNPDVVSCNVLLAEFARVGGMDLARELFDKMLKRDLVSWNTMIHGYASVGEVGQNYIPEKICEREIVSRSLMIGNYSKNRQSIEALNLFHEMQLANVEPDKVTIIGVLLACGDVGALGVGKTIHEYVWRNKIEIDLNLGTALLNMYAKCGNIDNSLKVFNFMNIKVVFAWSSMIVGLANHGLGDLALEYFTKMITGQVKPNEITFIGVLSACSHIGMVDKGWAHFKSMSDVYGISPRHEHYGCMVDILGRAGKLQEARELVKSMPFEPDAIIWRALLGACRIHKNIELAEEAMVNLIELEPHVDGNYVLLSNIYSQAKVWDKVMNVRRMMRNVNIQKGPGNSLIDIDNTVHEFVASDTSHPQSEEIYGMLAEVNNGLKYDGYQKLTARMSGESEMY